MKLFSEFISWLFMPLFMPIYALAIVFYTPSYLDFTLIKDALFYLPDEAKTNFIITFTIFGVLAPGFSLLILAKTKIVDSLQLEDRKDRFPALIMTFIYCILLYLLLKNAGKNGHIANAIYGLTLSGAVISFVFLIVNNWMKISLHTGGAGLLFGFVMAYFAVHTIMVIWPIVLMLLCIGLVMSSRLHLAKHTQTEAYVGFVSASLITFVTTYWIA